MALLPDAVDYTAKDFASIRERLFLLIHSVFPDWTDESAASFGNILVELFAWAGGITAFYQDNQAREAFFGTATQRKSLLALAKLIGFKPAGITAAQAEVELTLEDAMPGTVTVEAGTRVLTAEVTNPIAYQLLEQVVFAVGETSRTVVAENSETRASSAVSTGLPDQTFVLSQTPYVDGSAVVVAGDGTYLEVSDFLSSTGTDRHVTVVVDQADRATLRFGSGANGTIPQGTIQVTYKTGGGEAGRVDAGRLSRLELPSVEDSLGNAVRLTATNPASSSGGTNRATSEQIRQQAPASLRVLGPAIAREDYEVVAQAVPGVARALHLTTNEFSGIGENEGVLYLVPDDVGTASAPLIEAVYAEFKRTDGTRPPHPKPNTYQLTIQSASYLVVDVSTTVWFRQGTAPAAGAAAVRAALTAFFAVYTDPTKKLLNDGINFGFYAKLADGSPANELAWSNVLGAIRGVSGVRKLDDGPSGLLLNGQDDDVGLDVFRFPKLGTIDVIDGATGAHL